LFLLHNFTVKYSVRKVPEHQPRGNKTECDTTVLVYIDDITLLSEKMLNVITKTQKVYYKPEYKDRA